MSTAHSFPPVAQPNAQVLILGSMPGKASLVAHQYYAFRHNAFWPIMEALYGIAADLPYHQRLVDLQHQRIALWDVMQTCNRPSSLDADIVEASIIPNDFSIFFASHPAISRIGFNGIKAANTYRKYVWPTLNKRHQQIHSIRLPSTSPAHATLRLEKKLDAWRAIVY